MWREVEEKEGRKEEEGCWKHRCRLWEFGGSLESFNSTKTQDFYSALGYAYIHISLKKKKQPSLSALDNAHNNSFFYFESIFKKNKKITKFSTFSSTTSIFAGR